jgi:hypothetical protein
MKTLMKSAFGLNLITVLLLSIPTILFLLAELEDVAMFFGIPAFIFLMLLPSCSTKK